MSLDYKYTCPQIDSLISQFQDNLYDLISNIVQETNPLYAETEKGLQYISQQHTDFYNECEGIFESLRETNSDMRDVANHQINNLKQEIESLERQLR